MRLHTWKIGVVCLGLSALGACDNDDSGAPEPHAELGGGLNPDEVEGEFEIVDDLPASVPAPGEGVLEYSFPERIVPPGTEVVSCVYMEPTKEDLWVRHVESFQGTYGHHFVVFKISHPIFEREPGHISDCESGSEMLRITPAVSSSNFGVDFPEGMGVFLPAGTQLVLQQHYVNTSLKGLRVKDVMHLETVTPDAISERAGFWGHSDIAFELAPEPGEQLVTFDCTVPRDMMNLMVGPHMHEWGLRFQAQLVRDGEVTNLVDLDHWDPEYRDLPPVTSFVDEPLQLKKGDIIRTNCWFENTLDEPLKFPQEMCATYGYFYPAVDDFSEWICAGEGDHGSEIEE